MRLTAKLLLAILLVFGASAALNVWILNATVEPSFDMLERDQALQDGRRIIRALEREGEHQSFRARDWGFWNDTYSYAQGQHETYEHDNLYPYTLNDLAVNAFYILNNEGEVLWSMFLDLDTEEQFTVPELPTDRFPSDHPVLTQRQDDRAIHGLMRCEAGFVLLSIVPILTNESEGPPAGTLFFGRLLTPDLIDKLKGQTAVDFTLVPLVDDDLSEGDRQALTKISETSPFDIEEASADLLIVRTLLRDLEGEPIGLLRISNARDVTQIGKQTKMTALVLLLLVGFLILVAIGIFVRTIIIAPLSDLTRRVASIGETGQLPEVQERQSSERADELGLLAREFDAMVRQLRTTRERLMEQSFYSGRAESTAGVLHNIRNALNPVNMALWRISRVLEQWRHSNEERAIRELQDGSVPEERRAKLWQYLATSVERSNKEATELLEDVNEVVEQHRKVEEILVQHDNLSRYEQPADNVELAGVISEAAKVISSDQRPRVEVIWPDALPAVKAHRVLLVQVLSNLFINAAESIAAAGRHDGEIVVTFVRAESSEDPEVLLTVTDNGEGIVPDKLDKIFERGYSTRSHKHGGLGLHWCAKSLAGMGGRIAATSEGLGKGAAFHICLPAGGETVTEAAQ